MKPTKYAIIVQRSNRTKAYQFSNQLQYTNNYSTLMTLKINPISNNSDDLISRFKIELIPAIRN